VPSKYVTWNDVCSNTQEEFKHKNTNTMLQAKDSIHLQVRVPVDSWCGLLLCTVWSFDEQASLALTGGLASFLQHQTPPTPDLQTTSRSYMWSSCWISASVATSVSYCTRVDDASEAEVLMFSDDKTYIHTRTSVSTATVHTYTLPDLLF